MKNNGAHHHRLVALFIVLGILSIVHHGTVEARWHSSSWGSVPAVFAFGDSLVDAGTNNFIPESDTLANFPPYGETFFHKPTGRFSNGRLVLDFVASYLGLPFMQPFLKPGATFERGANFASAGSGILSTTGGEGVVPLTEQVEQYQEVAQQLTTKLGVTNAQRLISKSFFAINTGGNDFNAYLRNTTLQEIVSPAEFVKTLLAAVSGYVQTLYTFGARKMIVFGVGPLGCVPGVLAQSNLTNGECVEEFNTLVQSYNHLLLPTLTSLSSQFPGLHIVVGNSFDLINHLVRNGTSSGFTEGSNACCGSGPFNGAVRCGRDPATNNLCDDVNRFVFWDTLHPTQRINRLIATLLWRGDSSIIQPIGLHALAKL